LTKKQMQEERVMGEHIRSLVRDLPQGESLFIATPRSAKKLPHHLPTKMEPRAIIGITPVVPHRAGSW